MNSRLQKYIEQCAGLSPAEAEARLAPEADDINAFRDGQWLRLKKKLDAQLATPTALAFLQKSIDFVDANLPRRHAVRNGKLSLFDAYDADVVKQGEAPTERKEVEEIFALNEPALNVFKKKYGDPNWAGWMDDQDFCEEDKGEGNKPLQGNFLTIYVRAMKEHVNAKNAGIQDYLDNAGDLRMVGSSYNRDATFDNTYDVIYETGRVTTAHLYCYAGETIGNSAAGRCKDDANSPGVRRVVKFGAASGEGNWRTFIIKCLSIPMEEGESAATLMAKHRVKIRAMERLAIHFAGGPHFALNSAGAGIEVGEMAVDQVIQEPMANVKDFVAANLPPTSDVALAPSREDLLQKYKKLSEEQYAGWKQDKGLAGKIIDEDALARVIEEGSYVSPTTERVTSTQAKDIPQAEFGGGTGLFMQHCGSGPLVLRNLRLHVRSPERTTFTTDATTDSQFASKGTQLDGNFGPFTNLWCYGSKHLTECIARAAAEATRRLAVVQPTTVQVWSAKIWRLLTTGWFSRVQVEEIVVDDEQVEEEEELEEEEEEEVDLLAFGGMASLDKWKDMAAVHYTLIAGSLRVLVVAGESRICLASIDPGVVKYNPPLREGLLAVILLTELVQLLLEVADEWSHYFLRHGTVPADASRQLRDLHSELLPLRQSHNIQPGHRFLLTKDACKIVVRHVESWSARLGLQDALIAARELSAAQQSTSTRIYQLAAAMRKLKTQTPYSLVMSADRTAAMYRATALARETRTLKMPHGEAERQKLVDRLVKEYEDLMEAGDKESASKIPTVPGRPDMVPGNAIWREWVMGVKSGARLWASAKGKAPGVTAWRTDPVRMGQRSAKNSTTVRAQQEAEFVCKIEPAKGTLVKPLYVDNRPLSLVAAAIDLAKGPWAFGKTGGRTNFSQAAIITYRCAPCGNKGLAQAKRVVHDCLDGEGKAVMDENGEPVRKFSSDLWIEKFMTPWDLLKLSKSKLFSADLPVTFGPAWLAGCHDNLKSKTAVSFLREFKNGSLSFLLPRVPAKALVFWADDAPAPTVKAMNEFLLLQVFYTIAMTEPEPANLTPDPLPAKGLGHAMLWSIDPEGAEKWIDPEKVNKAAEKFKEASEEAKKAAKKAEKAGAEEGYKKAAEKSKKAAEKAKKAAETAKTAGAEEWYFVLDDCQNCDWKKVRPSRPKGCEHTCHGRITNSKGVRVKKFTDLPHELRARTLFASMFPGEVGHEYIAGRLEQIFLWGVEDAVKNPVGKTTKASGSGSLVGRSSSSGTLGSSSGTRTSIASKVSSSGIDVGSGNVSTSGNGGTRNEKSNINAIMARVHQAKDVAKGSGSGSSSVFDFGSSGSGSTVSSSGEDNRTSGSSGSGGNGGGKSNINAIMARVHQAKDIAKNSGSGSSGSGGGSSSSGSGGGGGGGSVSSNNERTGVVSRVSGKINAIMARVHQAKGIAKDSGSGSGSSGGGGDSSNGRVGLVSKVSGSGKGNSSSSGSGSKGNASASKSDVSGSKDNTSASKSNASANKGNFSASKGNVSASKGNDSASKVASTSFVPQTAPLQSGSLQSHVPKQKASIASGSRTSKKRKLPAGGTLQNPISLDSDTEHDLIRLDHDSEEEQASPKDKRIRRS